MINGNMIGGILVAVALIYGAFYAGTWFSAALSFEAAHRLDAARESRPVACSFNLVDVDHTIRGYAHVRDGLMRFDIEDKKTGNITRYSIEIDMNDPGRMASRPSSDDIFTPLDSYPQIRVSATEDLKHIVGSDSLHCAPWWSGASFKFALQGTN